MQKTINRICVITCVALALGGCIRANNELTPGQLAQTNSANNMAPPQKGMSTLYLIPLYSRTCLGDCPDYRGSYVFIKDPQGRYFYLNSDNIECFYVKPGNYQLVVQNANAIGRAKRTIMLNADQESYFTIMNNANSTNSGAKISSVPEEAANYYVTQRRQCNLNGTLYGDKHRGAVCQVFNPDQGFTYQAQRWTVDNPNNARALSAFNFQQCSVTFDDNTTQQCKYGFLSKTFLWNYSPTNKHCPRSVGQIAMTASNGYQVVKDAQCQFSED